jgi:hypothetical protein
MLRSQPKPSILVDEEQEVALIEDASNEVTTPNPKVDPTTIQEHRALREGVINP